MNFELLLQEATSKIADNYFQLPIDGREDPIYRERVYCYELYHQLRSIWPTNSEYELSGEVDKSGHPLIRGNDLDNVKPDFLIHTPGDMQGNHTVLEVKPITASRAGIVKDLMTLTAFRRYANYSYAYYLFYGFGEPNTVIEEIKRLHINDPEDKIDIELIHFWWHEAPSSPAQSLEITAEI